MFSPHCSSRCISPTCQAIQRVVKPTLVPPCLSNTKPNFVPFSRSRMAVKR